MNLPDKILEFMKKEAYKPLTAEDLAEEMEIKGKELAAFWQVLKELEASAAIIKTRFDKYGVPERMNLVVGRFAATSKGFGFVIQDSPQSPEEMQDIFIPPDGIYNAMHNDRVVVRLQQGQVRHGRSREGEIIRIVKRANTKIVGTFEHAKNFGFVVSDDSRIGQDIFVAREHFNGARTGAKVVVEITEWPDKKRSAEGKIVEILGQKGDPGIEILSMIKRHNLPTDFPPEVLEAAKKVKDKIDNSELIDRTDLRQLPIVTIDSEDAKDLDDGVHVERLKNGHYLLGVHIADVSYYVRENSVLDNEARERGTSVYLVDRVLPMLPQRLSNGICSLNAGVDRLAMSIHMEIDHLGNVVKYEVFQSVIHVHRRLSYNIVRNILVNHDEALRREYKDILGQLENMERLCQILRQRRMRRGAIDFDFPEVKVKLDTEGKPIEIVKRIRTLAESIVEEFMLVANETVAEHMHNLGVPFMFRVHEEPEHGKMAKLNTLLHNFGQSLNKVDEVQPIMLQKILNKIAGRPEERIISTVMLRSLKQARYEAENLGHFGLAAVYYTHFTSPIRRYPDLIVHRIIRETFKRGDLSAKRREKLSAMLPEIAAHSSERERAAAEAERDTVDFKKVEYMAQFVGEEFEGIINGVTSFGLFVELDNGIEGLVHVSSMDDDYYQYVEEQYALIGERMRQVYRLGNPVKVKLHKVDLEERNIDFVLLSKGLRVVGSTPQEVKKSDKPKDKAKGKDKPKWKKPSKVKPKSNKGKRR